MARLRDVQQLMDLERFITSRRYECVHNEDAYNDKAFKFWHAMLTIIWDEMRNDESGYFKQCEEYGYIFELVGE